jgi:hypothetical protein
MSVQPDAEEAEFSALILDLDQRGVTISAKLAVRHVVVLIAHVQLALRNPHNRGDSALVARGLCDSLIELIALHSPRLAELIEYGDDPAQDRAVCPPGSEN